MALALAPLGAQGDGFKPLFDGKSFDGWRGYHDHNWGPFALQSDQYDGWEWAVAHEPGGRAALLGGVVGLDGAVAGVLGRFGADGWSWCRPELERSGWTTTRGFRYPTVVSDEAFREDMGYAPQVTTVEALRSLRNG